MRKSQGLVVILCMFLFTVAASATQFKVGGSNGWVVPQPNTISYNQWAQRNRFKIGDSLLFTYAQGGDSVLLVKEDAYNNCDTSSPIKKFDDGQTIFTFERSGLFFFISGVKDNCLKKESLVVAVMADRTKRSTNQPPASPPSTSLPSGSSAPATSPSGSHASAPATSPSNSNASAPATSPSSSVSSPPTGTGGGPASPGTGETGPSVAPTGADNNSNNPNPLAPSSPEGEEGKPGTPSSSPNGVESNNSSPPPPNGASLKVVGLAGSIGSLIALAMFAY